MPTLIFTVDMEQELIDNLKAQWEDGCQVILGPANWKSFDEHPPIVLGGTTSEYCQVSVA